MFLNQEFCELPKGKRIYFASDFHLDEESREREAAVVEWLDQIKNDAAAVFLVGDVFDFWFEYRHVVPKGFLRFLGKLVALSDMGIPLIIFTGNHDLWLTDYLPSQMKLTICTEPMGYVINNKIFFIAHGDGLGPGDSTYKFLKKIFLNPLCRWAFRWLHPDIGIALAKSWSGHSKIQDRRMDNDFKGDREALLRYCHEMEEQSHFDYYIFGHRHLPLDLALDSGSRYINLGEWLSQRRFGVFDGIDMKLDEFQSRL